MSSLQKFNITFLVDSNPAAGSTNLRDNGSTFDVALTPPLIVPRNAENIYIEVKNATVWWSVPNVSPELQNDQFSLTYPPFSALPVQITIPTGLYSFQDLSTQIQIQLSDASSGGIPEDIIELVALSAENKIAIRFNYPNTTVDFTIANSIRNLIGFDAIVVNSGVTVPVNVVADNIAEFNAINYFLIAAPTLLSRGLNFNSNYESIIARVPIDVPPNSQIQYDPRQTYKIPATELAGTDFTSLTFSLTDDSGQTVDTRGEFWSTLFVIHYEVPRQHVFAQDTIEL